VIGFGVVRQRHDGDAVSLDVAGHALRVNDDVVAAVADQFCDFETIALQPAAGKQADNTERDTHLRTRPTLPTEQHTDWREKLDELWLF
jgi:hypothetical protein